MQQTANYTNFVKQNSHNVNSVSQHYIYYAIIILVCDAADPFVECGLFHERLVSAAGATAPRVNRVKRYCTARALHYAPDDEHYFVKLRNFET